jgi:hypothetical protein
MDVSPLDEHESPGRPPTIGDNAARRGMSVEGIRPSWRSDWGKKKRVSDEEWNGSFSCRHRKLSH